MCGWYHSSVPAGSARRAWLSRSRGNCAGLGRNVWIYMLLPGWPYGAGAYDAGEWGVTCG